VGRTLYMVGINSDAYLWAATVGRYHSPYGPSINRPFPFRVTYWEHVGWRAPRPKFISLRGGCLWREFCVYLGVWERRKTPPKHRGLD
jgi:hypothetical protein